MGLSDDTMIVVNIWHRLASMDAFSNCTILGCLNRKTLGHRSRISSLRGQGHFHFEKDTFIGKSYEKSLRNL